MRQLELHGRRYWILSEPHASGWKASVVELIDRYGEFTEPVGIDARAEPEGRRTRRRNESFAASSNRLPGSGPYMCDRRPTITL